jgi:hypothetical protein
MPTEKTVRFLNVDLLVSGKFDRGPLMRAMGKAVFALHERALVDGLETLIIEVNSPNLDLAATLGRLIGWVKALPAPAKRAWSAASRRIFDVGLQAGSRPHDTSWTIFPDLISAVAKLQGEIRITVYAAERERRRRLPRRRRTLVPRD